MISCLRPSSRAGSARYFGEPKNRLGSGLLRLVSLSEPSQAAPNPSWLASFELFFPALHRGIIRWDNNVKRGIGRPNLTWVEAIKRDLKEWNIPRELCLDRCAWKEAIHVPKPCLGLFPFSSLKSFFPPFLLLSPFGDLLGFNSSLPQLAWD